MPKKPVVEKNVPSGPEAKPRSETSNNLIKELYTGTAEKTFEESSYNWASQQKPYNPDDLYRKAGDYSIYEDMLNDDQVQVCVQIKRDLVVGSGWDIVIEDEGPGQEDIQKDLKVALGEDPQVAFEDMLQEIISADCFGFSLSEKIFQNRPDGSLTLKAIKTRHPSTWLIHTDSQGNIEKYEQRGPSNTIEVNPKSLIHYVNNRAFQNPYGRSDLRAAYNAWFVKRQVVKFYGIFLEKAASPTPVAKYDKNAPAAAVAEIHNAIKSLQTKTAMTIPKEIEVEFLEASSNGEAFTKGINIFNMFIGRAMMIPDLLGFQGDETSGGSYALGKDQIAILFKHIMRRRATLERIVNKEIIWPLVVYNHGFVEAYPKFRLKPISEDHALELAKVWLEAVKGKTYKASEQEINHFRSIVRFPQGEVEYPEEPKPFGEEGEADDAKQNPKDEKSGEDKKPPAGADSAEPKDAKGDEAKGGKKQFNYQPCPGEHDRKVDYSSVQDKMENGKQSILQECEPLVKRVYDDLYDQIKARKILQTQDVSKIEGLDLKFKGLKDLNLILRRHLREGYRDGQASGMKEILRSANFKAPLPDEKFLELLETETFSYIGDWSYNITKKARIKILEAIRDGKPISSLIDVLEQEGVLESMASIERFGRTKFTEVMNRGRLAAFSDSGVVAAYQYSAILDDRTSEICDGLHGKIFKAGDEPIPPMHFNCRSLLVPITKYESYEADEKVGETSIGDFIEENKGDGFAKR